jgi:hypothetical protein
MAYGITVGHGWATGDVEQAGLLVAEHVRTSRTLATDVLFREIVRDA